MDIGIISSRYGRALLKYATKNNQTEEVYQGMMILGESFKRTPKLKTTLEDPVLNDEKKYELICLAAGKTENECLQRFFKMVIEKRRIAMLQFMAQSYINSYRKQNKIIQCRLTVPVELKSETIDKLKAMVKGKTQNEVEFAIEIDPTIIGGFIMEYDANCFDASIRTRLRKIKKELMQNNQFLTSNVG
ncbi:MAG: F0F1 ATP synthase subunit delta [Prevotellaceae bacterium]|nr:F0F1 ATP synthase subunit delta [Candidatus Faecinaster equi]